ncbi:MAG: hypothetical protein NTZ05_15210, partial [Chloroflexi bacterium]|nr:hypothetical protein [Chloroflexota bacterium]
MWAGAADDSQFATDGAVWTTVPGKVRLKYELRNIGEAPLRNVTLTDDNGTPANPNDDLLINKDAVANILEVGGSVVYSRDITVTKDTTIHATATGYYGAETAQSTVATDDAIIQVISQNTNASLKMIVTVTNTLQGQTYFGVPGPVSITVTVINNGAEPVRSIRAVLDA